MNRYMRVAAILLLVVAFGVAGLAKLLEPAAFQEQFAHFGLPKWWVPVTGVVELLGAALIALFKRLPRRFGAALLAATMAMAITLHLLHDPIALALPALALLLLAGCVALIPRNQGATRALAGA
jgi:uncharacterized membrane protein YphA (DoxX/SURF4 family)